LRDRIRARTSSSGERAAAGEASMGERQEAVIRSLLDCFVAGDRDGAATLYADQATWHLGACREPIEGRDAIRVELDRMLARIPDYQYTIRNIVSTDEVVFAELVDTYRRHGKEITMHWSVVLEIDSAGKISAERDYFDAKELDAQVT
jgi:limonene-1,2-epoxide hydrolase